MSWAEVLSGPGRLGEIRLDVSPGVVRIIPKSSIATVIQFTDDAWAKVKADGDKARGRERVERLLAEWKAKPWLMRVGRKCPVTLPKDMEEKA